MKHDGRVKKAAASKESAGKKAMRRPKARQCAALPCRRDADGALSVLLITSRETRRWVAPKGWPMPERGSAGTAAREAFEEAGVLGVVSSPAIGRYVYEKRLSPKRAQRVEVEVHRLDVIEELAEWPERSQRTRRWFTVREAAEAVEEEGLAALILAIA